jgi:sulfur-carrier protein
VVLKLLYFAWVREAVGLAEEEVTPPDSVRDVAGLIGWLRTRTPGHAAALADTDRIRIAVDHSYAGLETTLATAREVALFPPVTGG